MCGIAGWLGWPPDGEGIAERIACALRHRGPDARGVKSWPEATLIHTRLSIIDLSPAGHQPMSDEHETVWAVFNGEIYNHRALRHELKSRGHVFKGQSDAEVLPHLYEEYGADLVNKLRGMFALAIFDTKRRTLLLARDRFGIKPLFYAPRADRLAFASEIPALLELPGIDKRPDRQAIYDFAALFCIPAPETFYKGIRALQPGEMLQCQFETAGIHYQTRLYHRWSIAPNPALTLTQAVEQADERLTLAVRSQMESDVPLATLLSGGIDSSLVSVAAQAALTGGLRSFNVRFQQKEYDESWAALAVARQIGSHHEILEIEDGRGTWEAVTSLLCHAGQPFADTSLFAVHGICQLMRQHVSVALSGDGGDEGFGGYDVYRKIGQITRWQTLPPRVWHGGSAFLTSLARLGLVNGNLPRRMRDLTDADDTSVLQALFCWIRDEEHGQLCCDIDALPVRRLFERQWDYKLPKGASRLETISAHTTEVNTRLILPNDFLFKVDTASMRESLEIRVPMLDEDLYAFGLSLPHDLKVKGRTCKRVLREVAKRRLPAVVANKPKWGFGMPLDTWVGHDFKEGLRETLLARSAKVSDLFRPEIYRPVIEAFCHDGNCPGISRQGLYQRVIMLLSTELALERTVS